MSRPKGAIGEADIAIIGMSGRFPGAPNLDEFWRNLRDGVESISFFSEEQLRASRIPPFLTQKPGYVPARAVLEDIDLFDPSFFGFSPKEAGILDPQHRVCLECAWHALEHAGYDPGRYAGAVGVFAGASTNSYLLGVLSYTDLVAAFNDFQTIVANDKDFVATRVSYHLDLKGPSVNVHTACSTSLVAVHLACQSLLAGECEMALAGGVSVRIPQESGHLFQRGGILSADGHCRAFDAKASGTVGGNGVGIVVLKPLRAALDDHDCVHAVIKATAVNNDGAAKVGFTAPGIDGQVAVVAEALLMAGVEPREISYVEAHGTGTELGDPIEIAALNEAFSSDDSLEPATCAVGSVKTNVGHLDAAAGIAGLIKTVLALKHRQIPPSLHFEEPNPQIDFESGPFFVNRVLTAWEGRGSRLLAGVSSFGIGGSNAHVVLQEAPAGADDSSPHPWQLLVLSARTRSALETATDNLAAYLSEHAGVSLADAAHTLQVGRASFEHRRVVVCPNRTEALRLMGERDPQWVFTQTRDADDPPVGFLFPGQTTQSVNMALALYRTEPSFREQLDACAGQLRRHIGFDFRETLYPTEDRLERAANELQSTAVAQPVIFAIGYSLAQLWIEWGVRPAFMMGHSLGEYVAACLAGVFSLSDALSLVAVRGRLMEQLPPGLMLSVALPPAETRSYLDDELELAAVNAPELCVVSGTVEAVERLEEKLRQRGVAHRRLRTRYAFHSALVDPIVDEFAAAVERVEAKPPQIPFVSNLSGTWIDPSEAVSSAYWAAQLRRTVRFADGLRQLTERPDTVLLEVGPGQTLSTLARMNRGERTTTVLASLERPDSQVDSLQQLVTTLGQLWLKGVPIDWAGVQRRQGRRRVGLPGYPFERRRCWIESTLPTAVDAEPGWTEDAGPSPSLHARPLLVNEYVAPRNDLEEALAGIWQEVLGVEKIGVYDSFFDLGGHSLMATQLIARVQEAFAVELAPGEVFEAFHVAALSEVIERLLVEEVEQMSEEDAQRHLG